MAAYLRVVSFHASELYATGVTLTPPDGAPNAEFMGFSAPFSPPADPRPVNFNEALPRPNAYVSLVGLWRDVEEA